MGLLAGLGVVISVHLRGRSIISTWGEKSLFQTVGTRLLQEISDLEGSYKFIVSLHPRWDELASDTQEKRDSILRKCNAVGVRVNAGLDWEDYVVASDAVISDHSSLSLYHVLLGHPLLLADIPSDQYVAGSTYDQLDRHCDSLSSYDHLDTALVELFSGKDSHDYSAIVENMLDYRGTARSRYKEEIDSLLYEHAKR